MKNSLSRRSFFRASAGVAASTFWANDTLEAYQQRVNTSSRPSELKITDMRTAVVGRSTALLRIDTNQGIYGLGEVRDGASKTYALMLKSRLLLKAKMAKRLNLFPNRTAPR